MSSPRKSKGRKNTATKQKEILHQLAAQYIPPEEFVNLWVNGTTSARRTMVWDFRGHIPDLLVRHILESPQAPVYLPTFLATHQGIPEQLLRDLAAKTPVANYRDKGHIAANPACPADMREMLVEEIVGKAIKLPSKTDPAAVEWNSPYETLLRALETVAPYLTEQQLRRLKIRMDACPKTLGKQLLHRLTAAEVDLPDWFMDFSHFTPLDDISCDLIAIKNLPAFLLLQLSCSEWRWVKKEALARLKEQKTEVQPA